MEFYSLVKIEDEFLVAEIVEFECGQTCIYWCIDKTILLYPSIFEFVNDYMNGSTYKLIKDGVDDIEEN